MVTFTVVLKIFYRNPRNLEFHKDLPTCQIFATGFKSVKQMSCLLTNRNLLGLKVTMELFSCKISQDFSSFCQYDAPATANLLDMDLDSLQAATTPAAQVCQN